MPARIASTTSLLPHSYLNLHNTYIDLCLPPPGDDLPDARISGVAGTAARNFGVQQSLTLKSELQQSGKRLIESDVATMSIAGHLAMALLDNVASVDCDSVARAMDAGVISGTKSCVEGALYATTGALQARCIHNNAGCIAEQIKTVSYGTSLCSVAKQVSRATHARLALVRV